MRTLMIFIVLCGMCQAQPVKPTVTRQFRDRSLYFHPNGYYNLRRSRRTYNRLIRNHVRLQIQIRKDLTDTNKIVYRFKNGTILRRTRSGKVYVDYTPVWGTLGMDSYYRGILKEGIR